MIMEAGRIERFLEGNRELLEKVCQAIRENPGGDYRMEAICRDFGISKHKLKTGFPKFYGCTFHAFVIRCRMEKAKELLLLGRLPLKGIARECGYSNTASFSAAFSAFYGQPPSAMQVWL